MTQIDTTGRSPAPRVGPAQFATGLARLSAYAATFCGGGMIGYGGLLALLGLAPAIIVPAGLVVAVFGLAALSALPGWKDR